MRAVLTVTVDNWTVPNFKLPIIESGTFVTVRKTKRYPQIYIAIAHIDQKPVTFFVLRSEFDPLN